MIKVLIIEDDFRIANIHEEIVEQLSGFYVVQKVLNVKDAIQILRSETIDLLLLDVYLPDQLGTELLREIRNHNYMTDAIIISAAMEKSVVDQALRLGVFDIIFKPAEMARLQDSLIRYERYRKEWDKLEQINQSFIDQFFYRNDLHNRKIQNEYTPKGIDRITLERIQSVLVNHEEGLTAEEVAEKTGTSRTTARRYLEYLISIEILDIEQEYGIVGRPLRKYKKK